MRRGLEAVRTNSGPKKTTAWSPEKAIPEREKGKRPKSDWRASASSFRLSCRPFVRRAVFFMDGSPTARGSSGKVTYQTITLLLMTGQPGGGVILVVHIALNRSFSPVQSTDLVPPASSPGRLKKRGFDETLSRGAVSGPKPRPKPSCFAVSQNRVSCRHLRQSQMRPACREGKRARAAKR